MSVKKKEEKEILSRTIRVGKDLKVYERRNNSWEISDKELPEIIRTIELFKANNNFEVLIDQKNPDFLKGQISPEGKIQGARINVLPNGEILDMAYSIFAKNLTFHDESSHDHWDVIYQNPNGKYAYLYSMKKRQNFVKNKYKKVNEFEKLYGKLYQNVTEALKNKKDNFAIPMYTLLKTYMRVGNETYFKADGHKGLTTLEKKDINIDGKKVNFNFTAKSGVPMSISELFPKEYVDRLKKIMKNLKASDFVFANNGVPLKDTEFMTAFERYSGKKFYPHIVRSYYATSRAKEFLKTHKKTNKKEVKDLFTSIAEKLGHKRFSKKDDKWVDSYNVTVHHYLQPNIFEKINKMIK
ncbi:hypothetical protein J4474_02230 [Candidatus Pacearchaeota archaeon]|nr:hypothetical protein [Candidatus Pacearchaeota archaeon]